MASPIACRPPRRLALSFLPLVESLARRGNRALTVITRSHIPRAGPFTAWPTLLLRRRRRTVAGSAVWRQSAAHQPRRVELSEPRQQGLEPRVLDGASAHNQAAKGSSRSDGARVATRQDSRMAHV